MTDQAKPAVVARPGRPRSRPKALDNPVLEAIRAKLDADPRPRPELAELAGLSLTTLRDFIRGKIPDPSHSTVDALRLAAGFKWARFDGRD